MDAYFVSKTEDSANFEFCVNAYPKSLLCRAHSAAEADEWLNSLMLPLTELAGGAKSAEAPTGVSPKAEGAAATA